MSEDTIWSEYLRFNRRLKKIGIEIECFMNVPWIYLDKVNGKRVTETYRAEHGFTAFWYPISDLDTKVEFSDRREVFKLIRSML